MLTSTANNTDTLLRAALDGAGITSVSLDLAAPYLMRGELLRVLNPWISGRLTMYAALPSRKFIPKRSRVFLDYLIEHTQRQNQKVLQTAVLTSTSLSACSPCLTETIQSELQP